MSLNLHKLFHNIDASQGLVVAISGGSDSLALLLLVHAFLGRHPSPPPLLAVTVDHELRPEAADEALRVAAFCAARGIAHLTLVWSGNKPSHGVSAAARDARYDLLAKAAADFGTNVILTGHTLDDQAETYAMRAARGDGPGLSGMAAATLFAGKVWIVRPLLAVRRQELRNWLRARDLDLDWIDDPSNQDPAYERVRVRRELNEAGIVALAKKAHAVGAARIALSNNAAELIERCAMRIAPGLYRLDRSLFSGDSEAAGVLALRALLATMGGTPRLPDPAHSLSLFLRLASGENLRATLSRTLVDARTSGIFLRRESRDLPRLVLDGQPAIWDGRWRIEGPAGLGVAALGDEIVENTATGTPESLLRAAMAVEPGLFQHEGGADNFIGAANSPAAMARKLMATPLVAPFSRFLPGFDLALAQALGRLVEAPPLAGSPLNNHIRTEA